MDRLHCSIAKRVAATAIRQRRKKHYSEWLNEIPAGHFEGFFEKGIIPLLKLFGYKLSLSEKDQMRFLCEWAFGHVRTQRDPTVFGNDVKLVYCAHNGGFDEYDWFIHTISQDNWDMLMDRWKCTDFLDDSDPGVAQRLDLPRLIWHMISLDGSPAHEYWLYNVVYDEEQDEYVQEDQGVAFTGNRRTFS